MSESLLIAISASPHNREAGLRYEEELNELGFTTEWIVEPEIYGDSITELSPTPYARWIGTTFQDPTIQRERMDLIRRANVVLGVNRISWRYRIKNFLDPFTEHDLVLASLGGKLGVISDEYPRLLNSSARDSLENVVRDAHLNALGVRRAQGNMAMLPALIMEHDERLLVGEVQHYLIWQEEAEAIQ